MSGIKGDPMKEIQKEIDAKVAAARKAAQAEAEELARRIRQKAPVDTGKLRNSVSVQTTKDGGRVTVGRGIRYAGYIEDGTATMRAQPYIEPAVQEARAGFETSVAAAVKKA